MKDWREKYYSDEFIPRKAIRSHIKFKWAEGFTAGFTAGIILALVLAKIIFRFV